MPCTGIHGIPSNPLVHSQQILSTVLLNMLTKPAKI